MNRRELLEAAIAAALAKPPVPRQTLYARVVKNHGGSRTWEIRPPCAELQELVATMAREYGPFDWDDRRHGHDPNSWYSEFHAAKRRPFYFNDAIFDGEMMLWKTSEDELRRHALWAGVTLEFEEER